MRSGFTLRMQAGPKKMGWVSGRSLVKFLYDFLLLELFMTTVQVHKQQQELREDFTYKYFIIHPSPQKMKMN